MIWLKTVSQVELVVYQALSTIGFCNESWQT